LKPLSLPLLLTCAAVALGLGACNPSSTQSTAESSAAVVTSDPPPPLPTYTQPPIPAAGYVWTPGYWGWDDRASDYYWTPGTWVEPPQPGVFWTPGYWVYEAGRYAFHRGYWGSEVGFYGGIDYGYGYTGDGYRGGRWQGDQFYYNAAVNNLVGVAITTVFTEPVARTFGASRASFNGDGGVRASATAAEMAAASAPHVAPTPEQMQLVETARTTPALRASLNHGSPTIAATTRPTLFSGAGVTTATSAPTYRPPAVTNPSAPLGRPAGPFTGAPQSSGGPIAGAPQRQRVTYAPTVLTPPVVAPRPMARMAPPNANVTPPPPRVLTTTVRPTIQPAPVAPPAPVRVAPTFRSPPPRSPPPVAPSNEQKTN
jgi:hypothetical protein